MHWPLSSYIWLFVFGLLSTLGLVIYAWPKRLIPTVNHFLIGTGLVSLWCLLAALELLAGEEELVESIANAQYLPIAFTCVMWFLFALSFTRRKKWLNWRAFLVISIIPFISMGLAITNPLHYWMLGEGELVPIGGLKILQKDYAPWFWVHTGYSYALLFAGSGMIISYAMSKNRVYRRQGIIMVIGAVVPFLASILYLTLRNKYIFVDLTPVAMATSACFFAWGIFKYRIFDLLPIARSTLFECTDDPVFILDTEERIVDLNAAAIAQFDLQNGMLIGESLSEACPYPLDELTKHNAFPREIIYLSNEDETFYRAYSKALRSSKGEELGRLLTMHNITALKRNEAALMQAKILAENATKVKSGFLATMSHEIRTPMNGVLGFTSLLMGTQLDTEQRSYVDSIQTSGSSLLTLINDILDFSKIEAEKVVLENVPVVVHRCIEDVLDVIAEQASRSGIELAYAIDPNVPYAIQGDAIRIQQILVNLLSNAIKFTEKGRISISVNCVEVPVDDSFPYVLRFSVRDTGIGIPPDRLQKIFNTFTQADSSTTRRFGGTGLGLSICKELCALMGGHISVQSKEGSGSIFRFTILAKTSTAEIPSIPTDHALSIASEKQVLIVSRFGLRRSGLALQCSTLNMKVQVADTPAHALSLLAGKHAFDVLVIDYDSPESLHLMQAAKSKNAGLPVLLINSLNGAEIQVEAPDVCIKKPVKLIPFHEGIFQCLSASQAKPNEASDLFDASLATTHPLNILIAEDDKMNQEVARLFFSRMGYAPDIVSNGKEAVEAANRTDYDVIFMDVYMPEMDGISATRSILDGKTRKPQIIALTASVTEHDKRQCYAAGMEGFVSKPLQVDELVQAIRFVKKPMTPEKPRVLLRDH